MDSIFVLHENEEWIAPLRAAFAARGMALEEWFLDEGLVDLSSAPPEGIFYSRMSASSHTRGHRYAPELAAAVLDWLAAHGRRVVNDGRALRLELSKVAQYRALQAHGIAVPRTVAAVGVERIVDAARRFDGPFITKHNRAGKGLGVRLFEHAAGLAAHVRSPEFEPLVDGVMLVQEYIATPEPFITRAEFVGGRFLYALRVGTSEGFELCPADICTVPGVEKFRILEGYRPPQADAYEAFLAANGVEVAGIEFILDADGKAWTYDVNTNTNYNTEAEAHAGISALDALADFLAGECRRLRVAA